MIVNTVTVAWDESIADNYGWLIQYHGQDRVIGYIPLAPAWYGLDLDSTVDELREAVVGTARWEGIELAERVEIRIEQ